MHDANNVTAETSGPAPVGTARRPRGCARHRRGDQWAEVLVDHDQASDQHGYTDDACQTDSHAEAKTASLESSPGSRK